MEENNSEESSTPVAEEKVEKIEFKKPVLIGRIGKLPKKATVDSEKVTEEKKVETPPEKVQESGHKSSLPPAVLLKELSIPIPYKEPKWSGLCPDGSEYSLEVLKSGMIVERIELTNKSYYVFGRLANCDVVMAHPTISRHHAVLQYKAFAEEGEPPSGWYIYDLGSTHGTFLNKERLKSSHYTRVRVGHQIKFGSSSRTYIVVGPDFDCEGESELTVTEIKQKAQEMKKERDRMIEEAKEQRERERLGEERKREEQGIDWGMGEDAEEEPDLFDNPYAATANEELYLEDPKKTLRGYFEREGHELTYDCEERGVGQFLCRVELPIDDARGKPVMAEVIHKGKKKEAVIACALEACRILDRAGLLRQAKHDSSRGKLVIAEVIHKGKKKEAVIACALEACRILDRAGLLRQAKHESRRRKQRDWSADDYYDSDEDTFLDRTGSVEKKRNSRMAKSGVVKTEEKVKTYDGLLKEISEIETKIQCEEKNLERLRESANAAKHTAAEDDDLDAYMSSLAKQGTSMSQKADISSSKMRIQKLKSELSKTQRLAEVARPAHLPPLVKATDKKPVVKMNNSVVYGKRIRLKEDQERKPKIRPQRKQDESEFVEEVESDDEETNSTNSNSTAADRTEDANSTLKDKSGKDNSSMKRIDSADDKMDIDTIEKDNKDTSVNKKEKQDIKNNKSEEDGTSKKMYGPMRPPENYVIPENYFDQESDRDLPEIMEKEE